MDNSNDTNSIAEAPGRFIKFNAKGIDYLFSTLKWANFLAILGFIMLAIMFLAIIFGGIAFVATGFAGNQTPSALALLPLTIVIVIYFFPIYYLYQFARHSRYAVRHKDGDELTLAMSFLKRHYQFIGVLAIIGLVIYAIGLLIGLASMASL